MTADKMIEDENKPKKKTEPKFQVNNTKYIETFDSIKEDDSIMAELFDTMENKDDDGFFLS